ncbi:MAG: ABC transporter permease [Anaerolineales bacterium]|nr:ABC transporter permease [Anaerolineales bacterium]
MERTADQHIDRQETRGSARGGRSWALQIPLTALITVALWWALTEVSGLPAFIFPGPFEVWRAFVRVAADGSLALHTWVTLSEVLLGLVLGVVVATVLGYALAKSTDLERILAPYIVASQAIPIVAIAPLLIIWFGPGMLSKVLVSALIVFFPVLVNTIVGVRSVPDELYDLMRSLRAGRWQTFVKLEVPASLPVLIGGLKVGATLSVIGAVVGEFVGADRGLGFLINLARGMYDTPLVFVAILSLIALALTLYGSVNLLESWALSWGGARQESVTGPIVEDK